MNQRNEADSFARRYYGLTIHYSDELELLRVFPSDGNDHEPALTKLVEERSRQVSSGRGDEDGVEWSSGGKTECAVSGKDLDVGVAERRENSAGILGEARVTFNGKHLRHKFRQERCGVAGASANFENLVGGLELKGLQHESDDVRLRDGLIVADGQRVIVVGPIAVGFGDEFMSRDAKHGIKDARIGDAASPELRVDHESPGRGWIRHVDRKKLWQFKCSSRIS